MEEDALFAYWFTYFFALGFVFWFPSYVIKTRGKGLPSWGLAFVIVLLFIFIPLLALTLVREVLPSIWLKFSEPGDAATNVSILVGSIVNMSTLDKLYLALALLFIIVGVGQSCVAAWLLYVRHNFESLLRAIRLMWSSGLMVVLAAGVLPLVILGKAGVAIAYECAPMLGIYIVLLMGITLFLRQNSTVKKYYPRSHTDKRKR